MARRLLLLASLAVAGAALAACDNPAAGILSTAEKGQCFAVTGKDSLGQPKLIRTDCGTPGAVTAPPAAVAAKPAACVKPVLPVVQPCGPGATQAATTHKAPVYKASAHKASGGGLTYRSAKSRHVTHKTARVVRKAVRHKGFVHYEYVPASGEVFHSTQRYEYARPPETTELAGAHSYHREEAYVAPPPPPPPPPAPPAHAYSYGHGDSRQYQSRQYEGRQYEGRQYDGRQYDGRQYQGGQQYSQQGRAVESRSYSSSSQSSSSARYSSSSQGSRKPCNCSRDRRPVIIEQYERDGYLTWPGKSAH